MALTQATEMAKGNSPFCRVSDHGTRVMSFKFDLTKNIKATNTRLVANEIIEIGKLWPDYQVVAASIKTNAAIKAAVKLRVLSGEIGKDVATRYAAGKFQDLLTLAANAAAGTTNALLLGNFRPADADKTSAVVLQCTTASSAAETASSVEVDILYYHLNQE